MHFSLLDDNFKMGTNETNLSEVCKIFCKKEEILLFFPSFFSYCFLKQYSQRRGKSGLFCEVLSVLKKEKKTSTHFTWLHQTQFNRTITESYFDCIKSDKPSLKTLYPIITTLDVPNENAI